MSEEIRPMIFLHTEEIDADVRKQLLQSGLIPVKCIDPSTFRLLSPEPTLLSSDVLLTSALQGLVRGLDNSSASNAAAYFVRQVAKAAEAKTAKEPA